MESTMQSNTSDADLFGSDSRTGHCVLPAGLAYVVKVSHSKSTLWSMNPAVAQKDSAVISYLRYFFEYYGLGKCEVDLHCDNCSGQNKNNFVLAYLMWRTFYGLHHRVPLHFLIAEHTKFAPDCCFGLLKKAFRLTPVSSLQELGTRIQSSTQKSVNIAQIVGPENGPSIVPVYDWQSFLSPLFKVVRHTRTTIISPFYHAS